MKRALGRLVIVWLVIGLERVIWPRGAALGLGPDLTLLLLVAWLPSLSRTQAVAWGFVAGLLQDLAAPGVAGVMALSKSVGAFVAGSLPRGRYVHPAVGMVVGVLVVGAIQTGVTLLFHRASWAEGIVNGALRYGLPWLLATLVLGGTPRWIPELD